jgi:ATP phosphoribosyltransferase regulatory subunit HisZ
VLVRLSFNVSPSFPLRPPEKTPAIYTIIAREEQTCAKRQARLSKFASAAMSASGVNKDLRERRRALKAEMEEERNKAKAARYVEKQQKKLKAVLEKIRHRQYLRDAAFEALQVKTISTPSNPHISIDG